MQIPMVLTVQKNMEFPQLESIDQVLDVPVAQVVLVPQLRVDGCERPCDHAATLSLQQWRCLRFSSPPESWTSCCATETGTKLLSEALWWR